MSKGKSASVEIPSFTQPAAQQYSMPGMGTTSYANNTWGFNEDPQAQADRLQLETMRRSILSGLGITSPQREASLNQWQDTFTKEAMRTSMPQLEQTLFARGMGGSNFYQNAITDLISKIGTQGVLNREQLSQQDQSQMLQQLAGVSGLNQQNTSNMSNLMGQATGQTNTNNQQAFNQYMALLPYLAKVTGGGGTNWGQMGSLAGTALGGLFGGVPGATLGGSLGGGVGGLFGGSSGNSIDLSALAQLFAQPTQQYANISGMGRVPIAPADYYKTMGMGAF